ncbi:MAG TPA: EpsI family protein [Methylomirabilota bacterium]|nr:EpsI family protein [Methylomirabilota bacterium]
MLLHIAVVSTLAKLIVSRRLSIVCFLLAGGAVTLHSLKRQRTAALHHPLTEFPTVIGSWRGEDRPFTADLVQEIGADDYINRIYRGDAQPVELYVGFYSDERFGDAMHSPKNCLPGAGWEPVRSALVQIGWAEGRPLLVNEYLVEKPNNRDLVLYWYQAHGRVVASEYLAKFWLVADALKRRGADGAMIRVWTTAADGDASAEHRALDFAQSAYQQLSKFLPN